MQIAGLKVKNFKRFEDREFAFLPGINVVFGDNETGKSTLLSAIITALFIDPATRSKALFDKILPWQGTSDMQLSMTIHEDAQEYELIKNFQSRTANLKNLKTGKILDDNKLVQEAVEKLTKIPTASIYRATALVRQTEMAKVESSEDLQAAVQSSISGAGSVDIQKVKKKIASDVNDLIVGLNRPAKNPGRIKYLQDQIKQFTQEYAGAKGKWEKVIQAKTSGIESGESLADYDKKIEILEQLMENQKIFENANRELERIEVELKEVQELIMRVSDLEIQANKTEAQIGKYLKYDMDKLDSDVDAVTALEAQINAKTDMVGQLEVQSLKAEQVKKPSYGAYLLPAVWFLGGLVGAILVSVYLGALMVVGVLFGIYAYLKSRTTGAKRKDPDSQQRQVNSSMEEDKIQIQRILKKYGVANKKDFFSKKVRYITLLEEKKMLAQEIKGILGPKDLKSIKSTQVELMTSKKEIEVNELTDEVKNSQLNAQEYLRKRREVDSIKIKRKNFERKQTESEVRIEDSDVDADTVVFLEENLESAKSALAQAQEDLKVLELVSEAIEKSTAELSSEYEGTVVETIRADLPGITDKRYENVRIRKDFGIEVFSKEKDDWVDPTESLSAGTIDQIYFLYRLALLKVIEGVPKVPLLLDDPFVTFDKKRLQETKNILEREAKTRQILLFTHDDDFKEWGNLVAI